MNGRGMRSVSLSVLTFVSCAFAPPGFVLQASRRPISDPAPADEYFGALPDSP